jgi:hypothetical protein
MNLKEEIEELKKIYQIKLNKLDLTNERFFLSGKDSDSSIKKKDIQIITTSKESGYLEIFDKFGTKHLIKSSMNIGNIEKLFSNFPQFIRTHENYIVNINQIDYFSPSPTEYKGKTLSFKFTDFKAVLSASNSSKVKQYFKIKSLDHVEPWNDNYQSIIDENLRTFEKEIRFMNPEELKSNFKYKSIDDFNIREFMANIIWEYYNLLQIGKREPIEGNIRTFWYYLKPTLSKVVSIDSVSHYGIMINTFKDLIVNHKLFKYKDFGFIPDSEGNYIIGNQFPNIILVGEKTGHLKKLKRIQEEFGITIAVLGGMPSILSTEYLVDELEKVFDIKEKPVHLITLVDFNPSSAIIAATFFNQLKNQDVKNILSVSHLLTPESFTKEELPHVTDQIPTTSPADKTKLKKWMLNGGGIDFGDGIKKPLGIETEALILDFEKLKGLFKNSFDKIINGKSTTIVKYIDFDNDFDYWKFE